MADTDTPYTTPLDLTKATVFITGEKNNIILIFLFYLFRYCL